MLFQPPCRKDRRQIPFEGSSLCQLGIHGGFRTDADTGETEVGLVAEVPVVDRAAGAENRFSHKSAIGLQHHANLVEGKLLPTFSILQRVNLRILLETRSLRHHHIHIGVGAHDFRVDRDAQLGGNAAQLNSLVEGVHVGVLILHPVNGIFSRDMTLCGDAHIHLRGAEFTVNVLQLLRGGGRTVTDGKGIALLELVQRERTEGQGDTEIAVLGRAAFLLLFVAFHCGQRVGRLQVGKINIPPESRLVVGIVRLQRRCMHRLYRHHPC